MIPKQKLSGRERWILAVAPATVVIGAYVLWFAGGLYAELENAQKRVEAANVPVPPPPPSATLAKAKATQASVKRSIAEREMRVAELEAKVAALPKNGVVPDENYNPTHLIEHMESVFERNGLITLSAAGAFGIASSTIRRRGSSAR